MDYSNASDKPSFANGRPSARDVVNTSSAPCREERYWWTGGLASAQMGQHHSGTGRPLSSMVLKSNAILLLQTTMIKAEHDVSSPIVGRERPRLSRTRAHLMSLCIVDGSPTLPIERGLFELCRFPVLCPELR